MKDVLVLIVFCVVAVVMVVAAVFCLVAWVKWWRGSASEGTEEDWARLNRAIDEVGIMIREMRNERLRLRTEVERRGAIIKLLQAQVDELQCPPGGGKT